MLYLLAHWLHFEGFANLIRYQSFRSGAALLTLCARIYRLPRRRRCNADADRASAHRADVRGLEQEVVLCGAVHACLATPGVHSQPAGAQRARRHSSAQHSSTTLAQQHKQQ